MSEDQRYIRIDGRQWRRSDPSVPGRLASEIVSELMSDRCAVKTAKHDKDRRALVAARERGHP